MADIIYLDPPESKSEPIEELVRLCRKNDQKALDKFHKQFDSLIVNTIKRTLRKHFMVREAGDEEIVYEIRSYFQVKFLKGRVLDNLVAIAGLGKYIRKTAFSAAVEWIRKQKAGKDVLIDRRRRGLVSLNESGASQVTQEIDRATGRDDFAEEEKNRERHRKLDTVQAAIERLRPEERLIMKTMCLLHEPLNDHDIQDLAGRRKVPHSQIAAEIEDLRAGLLGKDERRAKLGELAAKYWEEARRAEVRLSALKVDPWASSKAISDAQKEIAKKVQLHERKLAEFQALVRPSNAEIAHLLGIPKEKTRQISLKVFRIRERLRKLTEEEDEKA